MVPFHIATFARIPWFLDKLPCKDHAKLGSLHALDAILTILQQWRCFAGCYGVELWLWLSLTVPRCSRFHTSTKLHHRWLGSKPRPHVRQSLGCLFAPNQSWFVFTPAEKICIRDVWSLVRTKRWSCEYTFKLSDKIRALRELRAESKTHTPNISYLLWKTQQMANPANKTGQIKLKRQKHSLLHTRGITSNGKYLIAEIWVQVPQKRLTCTCKR